MSKTTFIEELPVKLLTKQLKTEQARVKKQKEIKEEYKHLLMQKKEEQEIGNKLIQIFKESFFHLESSNKCVASLIAANDYYILVYSDLSFHGENTIFQNYLKSLSKKFNIRIKTYRVKPKDYYSGSGDDMVYYKNPSELRVVFEV